MPKIKWGGYKASNHPAFLWAGLRIFLFVIDPNTGKTKHFAVTVGDGYEVESRSHAYGVVMRKIKDCASPIGSAFPAWMMMWAQSAIRHRLPWKIRSLSYAK